MKKDYLTHLNRLGFDLLKLLGTGLSGSVYLARQGSLDRNVAVKFFDNVFSTNDPSLKRRFSRESKILAKVQHPNIPYVITTGAVPGDTPVLYTVMQYIEGETLEESLEKSPKHSTGTKVDFVRQALGALAHIHNLNVVHRDIKPSNLMIDKSGHCYLIDFSIGVGDLTNSQDFATRTGDHLGTPAYMSPEQMRDMKTVDNRSDIFSLGVVLLELLTGSSDRSAINKLLLGQPKSLQDAVIKACQTDPEARFQSAVEFARALGTGSEISILHLSPAMAMCPNSKCSQADWSPQGYYRGPNVIGESTSTYCTECGAKLLYECAECGAPFENTPHCGNCGARFYIIPLCGVCGSWLKVNDMEADTEKVGCSKCQRKGGIPAQQSPQQPAEDDFDDDIPF